MKKRNRTSRASCLSGGATGAIAGAARVLIVSPHFPPDTSAGTHRIRLLAPHLTRYNWEPTVVTVDPRDLEGRQDPELAALVPHDLRVLRVRAWSPTWTRRLGFGDLGIRALWSLYRTCARLLRNESFDALLITIYPSYPAILGALLKRRFGVPFILDYQDPWVGAWGASVGGGKGGRPDFKSRASRALAAMLERRTLRHVDVITAVSTGTHESIVERNAFAAAIPRYSIPLGGESSDYEKVRDHDRHNPFFDANDGNFHLCYVGTLLPLGFETLQALLNAVRLLKEQRPDLYARLRIHFIGTSNQTEPNAPVRVLPEASRIGIADCVEETPWRVGYLDALMIQIQASAILMMGSSERHYTASKLYPGLLARRPILAIYHAASSVAAILSETKDSSFIRLVTYDDAVRAPSRADYICECIKTIMTNPPVKGRELQGTLVRYSARVLAGELAGALDRAAARPLKLARAITEA